MIFAEVIGDPIAQSKSPAIHGHWLRLIGVEADYRATRVRTDDLAAFLSQRRGDPDWRGCNVTVPHKEAVIPLLDGVDDGALRIGAVNCVVRRQGMLVGSNSDIEGVAAALSRAAVLGAKAAIIGGGGGARAAIRYLADAGAAEIALILRSPDKAERLRGVAEPSSLSAHGLDEADRALDGASVIVNASTLGMVGADPMPLSLLDAVTRHAAGATAFDMVYKPLDTAFLVAARSGGARTVDGLAMLVGQARAAFTLFFGVDAPTADSVLLNQLTSGS